MPLAFRMPNAPAYVRFTCLQSLAPVARISTSPTTKLKLNGL